MAAGCSILLEASDVERVRLPQPFHLVGHVTRSDHLHFGLFESTKDSLRAAMDRMTHYMLSHRRDGDETLLDIGCGMGGTTTEGVRRGGWAAGISPDRELILYARGLARRARLNGRVEFRCIDLESFRPKAFFQVALMLEVLIYFPDLDRMFGDCRRVLTTEGRLIIADQTTTRPRPEVPFPFGDEVVASARAKGFSLVRRCELTAAVRPTFDRMLDELHGHWDELASFFAPWRPAIEAELRELVFNIEVEREAFVNGDLIYESFVFDREGR